MLASMATIEMGSCTMRALVLVVVLYVSTMTTLCIRVIDSWAPSVCDSKFLSFCSVAWEGLVLANKCVMDISHGVLDSIEGFSRRSSANSHPHSVVVVGGHYSKAHSCELGRPCWRNQFLDRISNPILGSSTRASFAGRQQVASQTRIAMVAETGEMVGASFLSICVTVGAASFGPPKARNLLSSALPFNVVARAPLFFWWVWRQLAAHPTSEPTPKPQTTWHSSEPTRSPPRTHLTNMEPTGNPPGTQQEPAWQSERNPRGAHESPRGTHWELTPNRI